MAKDLTVSLINVSCFSSHKLIFGENIKLPNVMNNLLSAGFPEIKTIGDHLLELHAAPEGIYSSRVI